ncbi:MAG: hypothetical protein K2J68_07955, partial [Treponemataceae bacterium]|nr:hypothetical protein [Treponemataceae bacterium]
ATENLGAWHLTILFYGDFSNLVYRIDQTVNVYANLTTDTFEGSAPYISGGAIALTQALLEDFQNTTLYVNAMSGKDTNTGTQFDPLQTFNRALELVNNSTRSADTEFRIFLQTDIADGATLELKRDKKLTVASAGADGTARTITSLGRTFTVSSGSELTVQSVAFEKLRFDVSGTFAMDGGEISGNTASNGGAICINAGGKATVANTKIHDNTAHYGGGVYVTGGAEFTMSSGTIHNNTAVGSSGGVYNEGTFIMTAGIISTNTATYNGGGVYVNGSGIFTMNGGEISNNTSTYAGGVFVRNNGTFTMKGGTILRNIVSETGGGVSVHTGTVEIKDGTIENNTAAYGGGIFVGNFANTSAPTTFKMDGGTVSGNNASSDGGGVYVTGNASTFTMTGGTLG